MSDPYLWMKTLHVLAFISWMAGMLYLPRLFVYHSDVEQTSPTSQTFRVMERRLLRFIMTPAMIVTWVTGLWLAWTAGFFSAGWFHGKLALVIAMSAVHSALARHTRLFATGLSDKKPIYFRILNEFPTLLLIGIVILVVIKPF